MISLTSRGVRIDPNKPTRVALHHGVSISVAGEHLDGGREHTVPYHIAVELVASNRAHYPAPASTTSEAVATHPQSRDPEPQSADAAELRRRRR